MMKLLFLVAALCLFFRTEATTYYSEKFADGWADRWVNSAKSGLGKFEASHGEWFADASDVGLKTAQDAKFYAISSKMDAAFSNKDSTLVLQFSVKHEQGIDCGGGYIKLLPSMDQSSFNGDDKYFIMFGPDICGATKKIHLIFNYNGNNLEWNKKPQAKSDKTTHFYTLVLNSDNTYEVFVDGSSEGKGNLADDWSFLEPKEIDDPKDKKPSDWVDEAMIDDPEDEKPDDWIDEATVDDAESEKPEDWDDEEDGEWERPQVPNPDFKGAWSAKQIPNPEYKGVWAPKQIANPKYVADDNLYLFEGIEYVGFDLWQVKSGTIFDNIIVTDSIEEADADRESFDAAAEKAMFDAAEKIRTEKEEAARKKAEEARKAKEDEEKAAAADEEEDEEDDDDEEDEDEEGHDEL